MKLSAQERAEIRAAFRKMRPGEKLEYIFSYYRLPIALCLIAAIAAGSIVCHRLTAREALLYVGLANVAAGDSALEAFSEGFVRASGADPARSEVEVYEGLYLSEDPAAEYYQYSYASRMKLLAAVNARQLDAVLMNRAAYDILSRDGYLLDLDAALASDPERRARLAPFLRQNEVVLEDNAIEYRLNEADSYRAVTRAEPNGLDITDFPVPAAAGFSGTVYLGVLANSPRAGAALDYAAYLYTAQAVP